MMYIRQSMKAAWCRMKRRMHEALGNEDGVGTVEIVLLILGILTPYYRVGIRCIE